MREAQKGLNLNELQIKLSMALGADLPFVELSKKKCESRNYKRVGGTQTTLNDARTRKHKSKFVNILAQSTFPGILWCGLVGVFTLRLRKKTSLCGS